jgi:hypothetical protein
MIRQLAALAGLLLVARPLSSQTPSQPLTAIDAELNGRVFVTRIVLGNGYQFYNQSAQRDLLRRVDTEVSLNRGVEYLAIWPNLETDGKPATVGIFDRSYHVEPSKLTYSVPVGYKVRVTKVEWHDDRLELWLLTMEDNKYAKLKFIFGKGFQKTATRHVILTLVSRALVLEDFERLQAVESEYPDLTRRLDAARSDYTSAAGAAARLQAAEEIHRLLRALERNRAVAEELTHDTIGGESSKYAKQVAEIDSSLNQIREENRVARINEIGTILKDKDQQIDAIVGGIQSQRPSGLAGWREQQMRLAEARKLFDEKATLVDERSTLGRAPTADEVVQSTRQRRRLESVRASLASQRGGLENVQTEDDSRAMERKLSGLRDTYTRAFGTPTFAAEANRYLALLQQMHDNRLEAAKNGSTAAADQATTLQKEIERTRVQLRRSQ